MARAERNYLVKVWGQRGLYTTEFLVQAGWKGGEPEIDPIHQVKAIELTQTACAWAIIGVIQGYVEGTMHMLPVVDGWIYDNKGNKMRKAE